MTVNVYEQYFEAEANVNGVRRRGALVMLISDSEAGEIHYEAAVTFFPHRDEEDFGVSYDAYFSKVIFEARGRRSKKREAKLLEGLPEIISRLSEKEGAKVYFDRPLRPARRG